MQLEIPLVRNSDPSTSHSAASKAREFKACHEAKIFEALHNAGNHGATYREIAAASGLEPVAVARRLKGMETVGTIQRNALYDCSGFETRDGMCIWFVVRFPHG